MSINTIQLNTRLLADLYKDSLIETSATTVPESKQLIYLGNNQKNILVIVSHSNIPFLPDEELSFLTTILAACKLGIADIGIINNNAVDSTELQKLIHSGAKTILLFGVEPLSIELPINFPAFQLQQFNKRTYLHAPSLSQIENDKALKSRLLNSLKALFGI